MGNPQVLQPQDQVQSGPLSRKTSIHSPYVISLVAVKEALLWGRDTPNLEMLHGESLVNKEKAVFLSSFSKKLQFL